MPGIAHVRAFIYYPHYNSKLYFIISSIEKTKKERSLPKSQNQDSHTGLSLQSLRSHPHDKLSAEENKQLTAGTNYPSLKLEASCSKKATFQPHSTAELSLVFQISLLFYCSLQQDLPESQSPTKAHSNDLFPVHCSQSLPAHNSCLPQNQVNSFITSLVLCCILFHLNLY